MTILLIEDEYPAAERLQRLLRQADPTAQVLAVVQSVAVARQWLADNPAPDLILSDIQLSDGLSFEIFSGAGAAQPHRIHHRLRRIRHPGLPGPQHRLSAQTHQADLTCKRPWPSFGSCKPAFRPPTMPNGSNACSMPCRWRAKRTSRAFW